MSYSSYRNSKAKPLHAKLTHWEPFSVHVDPSSSTADLSSVLDEAEMGRCTPFIFMDPIRGRSKEMRWGRRKVEWKQQSHKPPEAYIEHQYHEEQAGGSCFGISRAAVQEFGIMTVFLGKS